MTIEMVLTGANIIAMFGYFMRTENRLTRMETKIDIFLPKAKP